MVILPFMKYGDLHSFLLRSRLEMAPQVTSAGGRGPVSVRSQVGFLQGWPSLAQRHAAEPWSACSTPGS